VLKFFSRGRWNRGTGHRETWKRGARSNRGVRAQRSRVVVDGYLCWVSVSCSSAAVNYYQLNDIARLRNGLNIRRPRKKSSMLNDKRIKSCIARFINGSYSRLQFLRAVRCGILSARIRKHYSRGTTAAAAARTTTRTTSVRCPCQQRRHQRRPNQQRCQP